MLHLHNFKLNLPYFKSIHSKDDAYSFLQTKVKKRAIIKCKLQIIDGADAIRVRQASTVII
jgi:hypothetical protein